MINNQLKKKTKKTNQRKQIKPIFIIIRHNSYPGCIEEYQIEKKSIQTFLTCVFNISVRYAGAGKSHCPMPGATSFSGRTAKTINITCPWASEL